MPKIYASLPDKLINKLKDISEKSNESFSKIACKMVELGLQYYANNDKEPLKKSQETMSEFDLKNREYLIRIMNINAEILRKTYDEPSKLPGSNVDAKLEDIKKYAQNLVENKLKSL